MESPISHYYMYTSHNTYLTGNQCTSDSSVKPIIRALQKGVRGIELDLWPNSTNTDINVCHGRYAVDCYTPIRCGTYDFSSAILPSIGVDKIRPTMLCFICNGSKIKENSLKGNRLNDQNHSKCILMHRVS